MICNYQYKDYVKTWMNRHLYIFNTNPVFNEQSPFYFSSTKDPPRRDVITSIKIMLRLR